MRGSTPSVLRARQALDRIEIEPGEVVRLRSSVRPNPNHRERKDRYRRFFVLSQARFVLPDTADVLPHHGRVGFARKCRLEFWHIGKCAIDPVSVWGV